MLCGDPRVKPIKSARLNMYLLGTAVMFPLYHIPGTNYSVPSPKRYPVNMCSITSLLDEEYNLKFKNLLTIS